MVAQFRICSLELTISQIQPPGEQGLDLCPSGQGALSLAPLWTMTAVSVTAADAWSVDEA